MTSTTDNSVIVDRLYAALARGDVAAARACFTPTARIWHNYDGVAQDLETATRGWESYVSLFPERGPINIQRYPIPGGLMQQYFSVVRTQSGERKGWPVCIVFHLVDGLIDRLDEYLDPKSSFAVSEENPRTPGF